MSTFPPALPTRPASMPGDLRTRELTLSLVGAAVSAHLAAPVDPTAWMVLAAARPADRPQAAAAARALHRLGLGVLVVDVTPFLGDPVAAGRIVGAARAWLAGEETDAGAIALGGAGHGAPLAVAAAAAHPDVPALLSWNGRFGAAAAVTAPVAPALLLLDRAQPWRERRGQRRLAAAFGAPSAFVVARGLDRAADEIVRRWQAGTLPERARFTGAPAVRRGAVAGLAAAAAIGVPVAAAEQPSRLGAGKVVHPAQVHGDGFADGTAPAPPSAPRPGTTVAANAIAGDGSPLLRNSGAHSLVDGAGMKWFVNTNVTFNTTSSGSGAASEASFTHAVPASTLNGGTTNETLNDAFDGYNSLAVHVGPGAPAQPAQPQTGNAAFTFYDRNGPATVECGGRQIVFPNQTVGDVTVSRKVYVPDDATYGRWMNVVTNNGPTTETVSLYVANNLGSDSNTVVFATSHGDSTPSPDDVWLGTFQNFSGTTSSDPRLGHILGGGHALAEPVSRFQNGDDNPYWGYDLTLAPGETQIVLNYAVGFGTKAQVVTAAQDIAAHPPLACTTDAERAAVANFDITAPVLNLPAPITAAATGPNGAAVSFDATATDGVDGTIPATCAPASGSIFPIGTTTVTCTATDAAGNTSTGTFPVTVKDTTPPVLSLPSAVNVTATGRNGAAVTFGATATDIVDGSVPVTCSPASGSTFPIGITTVTCTATDAAGNTSTGTFAVSVSDTAAPTLTLPKTITVVASSASGQRVSYRASAGSGAAVTCSPASGSTFAVGTTTVRCVATDPAGHTANGTFQVVVRPFAATRVRVSPGSVTLHEGRTSNLTIRLTLNAPANATYTVQRRTAKGWVDVKSYKRKAGKGSSQAMLRLRPSASAAAATVLGTLALDPGQYRVRVTAVHGSATSVRSAAFTVRNARHLPKPSFTG